MKTPVLSIVTPSYNQGEFIEETIKSVISQEGDFYLEYLIMDGGSTDETVSIIKKYDSLLKEGKWPLKCKGISYGWVSEKDKGQTDAIDRGFARAQGDIIAWLNSDDTYCGTKVIEKVVKEFSADHKLEVLTGDGVFIDRKGLEFAPHRADKIDLKELLYLDYHILQPATFMRREVYLKEKLDQSYAYCFDAEYFIRLIKKGYKLKKLSESLACFRIYPEIKTISGADKRYKESLRIARVYGGNPVYYLISFFYKYWIIVLVNKYPTELVKKITTILRILSYKIVAGRVR